MKKKVCALLLSAAMMVCGLAACGGDDANVSSDAPASGAPASSEASASNADAADPIANLIAATTGTVDLTVWASEEDQDLTKDLIAEFEATYPDVDFNITLGAESESTCKDTILVDVEAAADVFAFADDQINELVKAGALQAVSATYTYDVAASNVAGSIEAASVDGTLYAYPMTADNGYFMFYDKSIFTEDDVKSLEKMLEVAAANDKKVAMCVADGWYIYSFFKGAGFDMSLNADGSNSCDWNAAGGTDVAQGILDLFATGSFVNMTDEEMATAITEGTIAACVNGTWRAATAAEAWGENYAATKLPTYKVAGTDTQMSSFSGYKLIGVNPHSDNIGWSMLLAEHLTSEASQVTRFEARGLGPANINAAASEAVQADPAIAALAEQAAYATPQRVGGNYWSPAQTLGQILSSGNPDGTDLQELLDTAVTGIVAPVE